MIAEGECAHVRDLAPEVALGVAGGEDRAIVLAHTAGCSECRAFVAELSSTVDAVLLLAPTRQPPPNFETRVLQRLSPGAGSWLRLGSCWPRPPSW
jgi:predicted anti-sigma-YlaC factor YlaD